MLIKHKVNDSAHFHQVIFYQLGLIEYSYKYDKVAIFADGDFDFEVEFSESDLVENS